MLTKVTAACGDRNPRWVENHVMKASKREVLSELTNAHQFMGSGGKNARRRGVLICNPYLGVLGGAWPRAEWP